MEINRDSMNDFSYWFNKVKDCGIRVPKTLVIQTPERLYRNFYMEDYDNDFNLIEQWVKEEVYPELEKSGLNGLLFIKNSRFSNKFDAKYCLVLQDGIANGIANINYSALCLGANGVNELVIRERIRHNMQTTPCIYNGLPLRSEFRVFYDFDTQKALYTADYWDYNYVYPHLYDLTDKIVLNYMKDTLSKNFEEHKDEVVSMVKEHMKNVDGLTGKRSIDILLDEDGVYWLIDMAAAEQSAYWNPELIKE